MLALVSVGAVLSLHKLGLLSFLAQRVFPRGGHGSYRSLDPSGLFATVHVVAVFVQVAGQLLNLCIHLQLVQSLALLRVSDFRRLQLAVEFPLLLLRVLLVGHEVTSHN